LIWKFKVKWKGYPIEESSWETTDQFTNSKATLNTYKKYFPNDFPTVKQTCFLEFPQLIFLEDFFSTPVLLDVELIDNSLPTEAFLIWQSKQC
jgi:hypothetical protein